MPRRDPWSPAAFEDRYRAVDDPWSFATSTYELGRYAAILAALRPPPHRYRRAYEPACSVGVLTEQLARRCDQLVATDVSASAVRRAVDRCGDRSALQIEVGAVQAGPPPGDPLDLIVFSEVGYYFDEAELAGVVDLLAAALGPGGDLVACHWTGESPDHRLPGATVHEVLRQRLVPHASLVRSEVCDGFLLDAWRCS